MRRMGYALLPTCAVVLVLACGAPARPANTVVMASGTDLESGNPLVTIHPLTRQLQRHALFVTLVRLDSMLQPIPYFARRWSFDATQRVLTFVLEPTLRWHDGTPTTARDVQFTFTAARDPRLGAPRAGDLAGIDSVSAPTDTTALVYFRASVPSLPTVFAELPLVPRHLLDTVPLNRWRTNSFATAPTGNGPFRFLDRTAGRRWRFDRNDAFPIAMGGPPKLQHVVVAVVDEASTKFAGLVSGELDVAGVSPTMAPIVARDPTLVLMTPPSLFSTVLAFNTTRSPLNNARVRRAISLAIDRRRLVQAAVAGYAVPAGGAIPPGLPFPSLGDARFDTNTADALLDQSGWRRGTTGRRERDGVALALTLLSVGSGDQAVEQLIQSDLQARGIALSIRISELATFLTTLRAPKKDFDLALTGIPGDIGLGQLSALFASAQRGGALDYTGYHNVELDGAMQRARIAFGAAATEGWRVVETMLRDSVPMAWLYHARGVQGRSRRLDHVTMDLRGELVSIAAWTRRDAK